MMMMLSILSPDIVGSLAYDSDRGQHLCRENEYAI